MGNANPAVRVLLDAGADIDAHDVDGWTPLMQAARHTMSPAVLRAARTCTGE